jgi:hypothetical protein
MARRRGNYDPLATSAEPRWLKVQDRFRQELSSTRVAAGTDLRRLMRTEADRWVVAGWDVEIEDECRHGFFFIRRDGERRLVLLTARETPIELLPSAESADRRGKSG